MSISRHHHNHYLSYLHCHSYFLQIIIIHLFTIHYNDYEDLDINNNIKISLINKYKSLIMTYIKK